MKPPPTAPDSAPAELDAFVAVCDRLAGFNDRVGAEWLDGWLTALAAGLRVPPFERWIDAACGDAFDRAFADPEDRAAGERALTARLSVLRAQLDAEALDADPDHLRLAPLMMSWTDEDRAALVAEGRPAEEAAAFVTGADWADGFFGALHAFADEWPDPDAEAGKDFVSLAMLVDALRLPEGSDEQRAHVAQLYGDAPADRERLIDDACFAVQDLRLWVVDHAPRPPTRRVEKAPGRNDPCPCGSGRKFKKCHGA